MPIIIYRHTFSYFVGHNCRFYPTCSSYSLEAINSHGVLEGIILSIKRLARCHPWSNHSGVDPVPSPHRK
ncbi:MAG: membrane protein insertion efficiency factor YidD [Thalassobaculaceae bacterium]